MPKNVVEKIARERESEDAKRRQQAEAKEKENSLTFNPNAFREFVSSFRKSKLRVRPLCEHLSLVKPPLRGAEHPTWGAGTCDTKR